MKLSAYLISLLALFAVGNASAITITASDLPGVFQTCAPPNCSVALTSSADVGGMSAFRLREGAGSGASTSYLLRYSLYEPSTASSGYVWMKVQEEYSLASDQHAITLYLDHASPMPSSMWLDDSNPLDLDFTMTTGALLGGGGNYAVNCCSGTPAPLLELTPHADDVPFDSETPSGLMPCAAEGCGVRAELNLVYLLYQATISGTTARIAFDNADGRALLFHQSSFVDGSYGYPFLNQQSYYVAPVPLPAAAWLLLSGLGALGVMKRKQR